MGYYNVEDYLNHNPDEDNLEIDIDMDLEEVETLLDDEEE